MWNRYDEKEMGSKVISLLVTALKRLVTEKPALLGVCTQMEVLEFTQTRVHLLVAPGHLALPPMGSIWQAGSLVQLFPAWLA